MPPETTAHKIFAVALWTALALYAFARVCQVHADSLPILFTVLLHVIPPAAWR